jgi:hypothetical protein
VSGVEVSVETMIEKNGEESLQCSKMYEAWCEGLIVACLSYSRSQRVFPL